MQPPQAEKAVALVFSLYRVLVNNAAGSLNSLMNLGVHRLSRGPVAARSSSCAGDLGSQSSMEGALDCNFTSLTAVVPYMKSERRTYDGMFVR